MLGIWPEPGKRLAVSDFTSKDDLIKSCMASVHIPYFMNQKLTALHRESRCGTAQQLLSIPDWAKI